MDVRAFGSIYGQSATLPYASGFTLTPDPSGVAPRRFAACRAIFIEAKATGSAKGTLAIELADAPNKIINLHNIGGDVILPFACTAVISGSVNDITVLY